MFFSADDISSFLLLSKRLGLQYLSVQQSLADHASFIQWFSLQFLELLQLSTKWVVVGGSYSGALVSWFKETYPNLAVAAYSSSGVVNAIVNFWQFDHRVAIAVGTKLSCYSAY